MENPTSPPAPSSGDRRFTPIGLRVDRVPNQSVERDPDGRLAIKLWLHRDGKFAGDVPLRLSPAEAEVLHAQLCFALDAEPVTTPADGTPLCRKTTTSLPSPYGRP